MRYEFGEGGGGLIHGRGLFSEFYGIFCMCRLWESVTVSSKYVLNEEQHQAVWGLRDVLAVLPTGFGKSLIY